MTKETAWIGSTVIVVVGAILAGASLGPGTDEAPDGASDRSGAWTVPEGGPQELADALSVDDLVARWEAFPSEHDRLGIHADYARALGILGTEAAEAAPHLAPYGVHEDPEIRKAVLEALARMGEAGLPGLLDALQYGALIDSQAGDVRWDAATAIAGMEPVPAEGVPVILERLLNFDEHVLARDSLAVALARVDPFPTETLVRVRDAYYARSEESGLSVAETGILRTFNLALQGVAPEAGQDSGKNAEGEEEAE